MRFEKEIKKAFNYIRENWEDYSGYMPPSESIEKEFLADYGDIQNVYRCISTDSLENIDYSNLGIYWTFNKERAKAYWGDERYFVYFTAKVKGPEIDWIATVEQYLKPQYAEDEVRLIEGSQLSVEGYKVYDKDLKKEINLNKESKVAKAKRGYMITKLELKKELQALGISVVGNRIKKKDLEVVLARRDLSHLPADEKLIEVTRGVFAWVIRNLFTAENALKPKRQIKRSEITPEVKKILDDIEKVSEKAKKDIEKVRNDLNDFIKKYGHIIDKLEIPF
jgi:hypothetical protein